MSKTLKKRLWAVLYTKVMVYGGFVSSFALPLRSQSIARCVSVLVNQCSVYCAAYRYTAQSALMQKASLKINLLNSPLALNIKIKSNMIIMVTFIHTQITIYVNEMGMAWMECIANESTEPNARNCLMNCLISFRSIPISIVFHIRTISVFRIIL